MFRPLPLLLRISSSSAVVRQDWEKVEVAVGGRRIEDIACLELKEGWEREKLVKRLKLFIFLRLLVQYSAIMSKAKKVFVPPFLLNEGHLFEAVFQGIFLL